MILTWGTYRKLCPAYSYTITFLTSITSTSTTFHLLLEATEANNAAPVADDVAACGAEPAARGRTLDMAAEIIRSKALVCSSVNGSCCCCCYCGSGGHSAVEIPAWFRRASTSYPLSFVLALHGKVSFSCFP